MWDENNQKHEAVQNGVFETAFVNGNPFENCDFIAVDDKDLSVQGFPVLSENGMEDLAYRLLLQEQNPSWLYSVNQGAATIWERWDSYTKKAGFYEDVMNSFNHFSYGSVGQ